jgi:hypothetical protein
MKVIFDACLSRHLAKALDYLMQHYAEDGKEYIITSVKEKFNRNDLTDVELLGKLGTEGGWVFISADRNIRHRPNELKAFQQAKLIGFFLGATIMQRPVQKQMAHLLDLWSEIENKVSKSKPGTMYRINTTSKIESI